MAKINFSQMEFCSQHQTQHAESFSTENLLKKPTKETYSLQIWHETAKSDAKWLGAHTLMGSMSTELRSQHLSQRLSSFQNPTFHGFGHFELKFLYNAQACQTIKCSQSDEVQLSASNSARWVIFFKNQQ